MKSDSNAFLQSFEWRRLRMLVLKRDGARCACCGATTAGGRRMNVDHIKRARHIRSSRLILRTVRCCVTNAITARAIGT